MSGSPIIRLEGVTKLYGGIAALQNADFELFPGEIHALVGENGAGKSTLCKLIAGVITPSEGRVIIDGQAAYLTAPKDAARYGISMVYPGDEPGAAVDRGAEHGARPRARLQFGPQSAKRGATGAAASQL